ncbi:MAG TPA: DUF721 domain-containing protein [Acetobacteraceae bacterium]|nr:DUF721 domain-containing protein [Acetobacteraceae bacterium]
MAAARGEDKKGGVAPLDRTRSGPAAAAAAEAPRRFSAGPVPVGALVPRITRAAFQRRAPATAQVIADWTAIVGPALAADSVPRRLSAGTLTIACSGPLALELQHLSEQLLERINTHLGHHVVQRLRFTQEASSRPVPAAPPPRRVRPEAAERAERAVAGLSDGPVRAALASLGRAVFGRP